jgi:hypothetical protein
MTAAAKEGKTFAIFATTRGIVAMICTAVRRSATIRAIVAMTIAGVLDVAATVDVVRSEAAATGDIVTRAITSRSG